MYDLTKIFNSSANVLRCKAFNALIFATALYGGMHPKLVLALDKTDMTKDLANGKNATDVANNIDNTAQVAATLLIDLITIAGFVVVAFSIYQLWRASHDERHKPLSAIVGIFVGGAMAAAAPIMWMVRNSLTG